MISVIVFILNNRYSSKTISSKSIQNYTLDEMVDGKTDEMIEEYLKLDDFRFIINLSDRAIPVFQSKDNNDYLRVDYEGNYDIYR